MNDKLEIYEEKCPHCHGTGRSLWLDHEWNSFICRYCRGRGKLDWIDKIKRRKNAMV